MDNEFTHLPIYSFIHDPLIYFFHGDSQALSRNKLNELVMRAKNDSQEIIRLDGTKIDLTQIVQNLESSSLFGTQKLVIIENLFSRAISREKELMIKYFKKENVVIDIIFWEKKGISGVVTRWLPKNWQIKVFKTPAIIFKLLDNLKPNNQTESLCLLHQCLVQEEAGMIFYMLAKRVRELILGLTIGKKGLTGAPWQIGKLIHQAQSFTLDQLINIYGELLKIDYQIKTGISDLPLTYRLDLLIVNL